MVTGGHADDGERGARGSMTDREEREQNEGLDKGVKQ